MHTNLLSEPPHVRGQVLGRGRVPDLSPDAVLAEMVPEGVPVRVHPLAHVTLEVLSGVRLFVDAGGGAVLETRGAPVADVSAQVARADLDVRRDGVPGDVQAQVAPQVLAVGEALQAGQARQVVGVVVV